MSHWLAAKLRYLGEFSGLLYVIRIERGGEHDDHGFTLLSIVEFLVFLEKRPSVHPRHIDIQKDQVRARIYTILWGTQIADGRFTIELDMHLLGTVRLFDDHLMEKVGRLVIVYQ